MPVNHETAPAGRHLGAPGRSGGGRDPGLAAWRRATPLAERLPGPDLIEADRVEPDRAEADRAGRRLGRWRRQEPFGDPALWHARLRADGLDEAGMLALLREPDEALAGRLPPPPWRGWLVEYLADQPAGDRAAADGVPDGAFLAPVMAPLLAAARARLSADLGPAGGHLLDQLTDRLRQLVHRMLSRTLTLELHLARLRGELTGDSPEERFDNFLRSRGTPAGRRALLSDYPVLARQLALAVTDWHATSRRLVHRIAADTGAIREQFAGGAELGTVVEVSTGRGDPHRGGESVAIVRWSGGLVLVYKPRPLAVDVAFNRLLAWLNAAGLSLPFRTLRCLDRGEYGWMEFVAAQPCASRAEIGRFYHRQGALLALLELLGTGDLHSENLIAAGEQPVPVDLETLFQPPPLLPETGLTGAERMAAGAAASSVLRVGLLPSLTWRTADGGGVDLSGLGHRPGQRTSLALPKLTGVGTDGMRVRLERVPLELPDHRPVGKDAPLDLLDYADDLVAGFTELHRLCRANRDALLAEGGPIEAFRGAPIRVLLRSTVTYSTVLWTGFHPDLLRDALERDRHFDFLWRQVARTPALAACIPAERRDLWRGDIPYFAARTDGWRLLDSDGVTVPGVRFEPGIERARRRLAEWDDRHLDGQLRLVRASLAAAAINASEQLPIPAYQLPDAGRPATGDELVAAAGEVADELAALAYGDRDSSQWLGLTSTLGRNWSFGPIGPDLFNGLTGVALFLAELSRLTGQPRHLDLARRAVATACQQLDREVLAGVGGMAGLPGVAYALCRLAPLLADPTLVDRAAAVTAALAGAAARDEEYDVVAGSAGTILGLRLLHRLRPDGPAREVAAVAAGRLAATGERYGGGRGWLPDSLRQVGWSEVPLAGLGHGTAGVAWALLEAARWLGEPRYAELAREALDYERSLFDPAQPAWRDVRAGIDDPYLACAWCHGAVGIGLARLASRELDPVRGGEIDAALAAARRRGFGTSHSLCHGDLGSIELLLTGARVLGRPELRAEAQRRAADVLASIRTGGWVCGVPLGTPTPSLLVGLAGIGYGLLRVAAPDTVPSVLTMEPGSVRSRA